MRNPNINTIGIMFDSTRDANWPQLGQVVLWLEDPNFENWLVIASDPNRLRHFDEDSQAMNETNWDAVVSVLPEEIEEINGVVDMFDEIMTAGFASYRDTFETYLVVSPDNEEILDEMLRTRSSLADYPLLDESSYSEREYNAWLEYVNNGLKYDTLSDLSKLVDEDTLEAIDNGWDDIAAEASQHLHYYNGWDGSHSPDFAECIATVIGLALMAIGR